MTITLETDESDIAAAQVVVGPARGPWATLRPMTDLDDGFVLPYKHQLDGERLFTSEFRGSLTNHTVVVRDPDPRDLQLPAGAVFAGDLVAYTERGPGQDEDAIGRRLVVAEWRTGVRRGVTDLPEPIQQHALRPDGRVAADAGHAPRHLRRPARRPAPAGDPPHARVRPRAGVRGRTSRVRGRRVACTCSIPTAASAPSAYPRKSSTASWPTTAACSGRPTAACWWPPSPTPSPRRPPPARARAAS